MRSTFTLVLLCACHLTLPAQDDYKPGPDSLPQPAVPSGEMLRGQYTAGEGSVFPGTEREYQVYLPAGFDKTQPAPFMVFQDGVIYQAPTVFDNLIAKKHIPPLVGIFIKPGVLPAANDNALPRFNRSYEYDSVSDTYARFLIDEFLPAVEQRHGIRLSTDPNDTAIAGNSSGGICAFMVAWHRPHRFRRVFTGVGTYVGIRGGDQLPVLVRKMEPRPLRVFLQSGENDNNLYCGDWWMANQMMERSLTWAGYDVNHAWGTGGHNQKHATAVFPDAMRWLWRNWQTNKEIRANPRGDSRWRGYEVIGGGAWEEIKTSSGDSIQAEHLAARASGEILWTSPSVWGRRAIDGKVMIGDDGLGWFPITVASDGGILYTAEFEHEHWAVMKKPISRGDSKFVSYGGTEGLAAMPDGSFYFGASTDGQGIVFVDQDGEHHEGTADRRSNVIRNASAMVLSPDQTKLFALWRNDNFIVNYHIKPDHKLRNEQIYGKLEDFALHHRNKQIGGLCVDTNGWLYVATSLGIQVLDQCGRVNFIISTPKPPHDVCFGGKDLSELFIACGDTIYKRPTKAHGYISGQMAPIKPKPPKL